MPEAVRHLPADIDRSPFQDHGVPLDGAPLLSSKLPSTSFQLFRQNKNTPGTKKFDVFSITLFAAWGFCGIISFCNMKTSRNLTDQSFVPARRSLETRLKQALFAFPEILFLL